MDILTCNNYDVKMTSYMKFFINLNRAVYGKFELDLVIILKIIQVSLFFIPKNDVTH